MLPQAIFVLKTVLEHEYVETTGECLKHTMLKTERRTCLTIGPPWTFLPFHILPGQCCSWQFLCPEPTLRTVPDTQRHTVSEQPGSIYVL